MRLTTKRTQILLRNAPRSDEPVKRGRGRPKLPDSEAMGRNLNIRINQRCQDILNLVKRRYVQDDDSKAIRFIIIKFGELMNLRRID